MEDGCLVLPGGPEIHFILSNDVFIVQIYILKAYSSCKGKGEFKRGGAVTIVPKPGGGEKCISNIGIPILIAFDCIER